MDITPKMTREFVRLASILQMNNASTQLVRAAECGIHGRPFLAVLEFARKEHLLVAFEAQLMAEGVTLVCAKEELETVLVKIRGIERFILPQSLYCPNS
jgi:hypothetical protein